MKHFDLTIPKQVPPGVDAAELARRMERWMIDLDAIRDEMQAVPDQELSCLGEHLDSIAADLQYQYDRMPVSALR